MLLTNETIKSVNKIFLSPILIHKVQTYPHKDTRRYNNPIGFIWNIVINRVYNFPASVGFALCLWVWQLNFFWLYTFRRSFFLFEACKTHCGLSSLPTFVLVNLSRIRIVTQRIHCRRHLASICLCRPACVWCRHIVLV